jgi:hypothetical protein
MGTWKKIIVICAVPVAIILLVIEQPVALASLMPSRDSDLHPLDELPTVSFMLRVSEGDESRALVDLPVMLSAPAQDPVTVNYAVFGGVAKREAYGSGQDYVLADGTLTFEPGHTVENIRVTVVNDDINEADEDIEIALSNPQHAVLGSDSYHTYTILDDDRKIRVNVTDFGAVGDGTTDDTQAVQAAVDAVYDAGGGVVVFPARTYLLTSVTVREGITYYGYGAMILRPPFQGEWTRTFTTNEHPYEGAADSAPMIIQGFTFDGNSQQQGLYQDHELEHAAFLFLRANPDFPGRLQVVVEDCAFQNGVADAISVHTNVSIKVDNCTATNVFRGGFVMTGGYSKAVVTRLRTGGMIDRTGIKTEVSGAGYGGTYQIDVEMDGIYLAQGDLDIVVYDHSTFVANNLISDDAPFFLFALDSTVRFTNCRIKVGASDGKINRILLPHDVVFENCDLVATRRETGRQYEHFTVIDVWWQHPSYGTQRNQSLRFINSRFLVDNTFVKSDTVYAIYSRSDTSRSSDSLTVDGGCISGDFDQPAVVESGGVKPVMTGTGVCPRELP